MSKSVNQAIKEHFDAACKIAEDHVEKLAREAMREHPVLVEFVKGMGSVFFVTKNDDHVLLHEMAYLAPLDDFFHEWDDTLKITGSSVRFTAKGPRKTAW